MARLVADAVHGALILTLDLGTSTTKAVVWAADGPRARGAAALETTFPAADRAEQDPAAWWPSVVAACADARAETPGSFAAVEAVGFAAARQTLVPVTAAESRSGPRSCGPTGVPRPKRRRWPRASGGANRSASSPGVSSTAPPWRPRRRGGRSTNRPAWPPAAGCSPPAT